MEKIKTVKDLLKRLKKLPPDMPLLSGVKNAIGGFDMFDISISADPKGDPKIDNCLLILKPKNK